MEVSVRHRLTLTSDCKTEFLISHNIKLDTVQAQRPNAKLCRGQELKSDNDAPANTTYRHLSILPSA
jgi:hypothetical protein